MRWILIRVPEHLARRLKRLATEFEASYVDGHTPLPNKYCEHVPLHYIIERALDELEGKRRRSRRPSKRRPAARSVETP